MTKDSTKGVFGRARLSLSKAYLWPDSRRGMLLSGVAAAVVLAGVYAAAMGFGRERWVSGGPLSSSHASVEADCAACHSGLAGVEEEKCLACHEPSGSPVDVHGFERHALYVSGDVARLEQAAEANAPACAHCHREHDGRDATPTTVADADCAGCHFGSFADHPEFDAVLAEAPDDSMLVFTHVRHTAEVLKRLRTVNVEAACLACHQPVGAGETFAPIDFDTHCADCHLVNAGGSTVPVGSAAADPPGAETLERIRARREPGTLWAFTANEADYRLGRGGNSIRKTRLEHPDPWVLENLKQIRRAARGRPDLADLIPTAGIASNETSLDLYREMLGVLTRHADALRGRPEPEIRAEVRSLDSLTTAVRVLLDTAVTPPPWTGTNPPVGGARAELVADLTRECRMCHRMDGASVGRVQKKQTSLLRARFDHAAHVLDAGCLDCHGAIPVTRKMAGTDEPVPYAVDRSAVLNLPGIDNCRECHGPKRSAASCTTCHLYHPGSDLPRFRRSLQ